MDPSDPEIIDAVRRGDVDRFDELVRKYSPRLFATARRYARREDEVEDLVQLVLVRAFQHLGDWRGDAPFEHWLMRIAVRACYDQLRHHRRNREFTITHLDPAETDWIERNAVAPEGVGTDADAARSLVAKAMEKLTPPARLVLTLLEIEDRSVREIASLTGWSVPLVKVRAFRARGEMRRVLTRMGVDKYL
ncbi:MAG: sigma-70 family RNA polymerase sigma factor [Verrucomicrobia bacterium]|nr:MAG: sigma-70 family RNA polymerase sigma factor [Verrucomicrobiota bacterium]